MLSGIDTIKAGIIAVLTFLTSLLGGWDMLLYSLLLAIVIDYVLGVIKAVVTKQYDSHIGWKGLAKKITTLCVIAIASMLDQILNLGEPWIRTAALYAYIWTEITSILENVSIIGVPIPPFITDVLAQYSKKSIQSPGPGGNGK
jgi:toxin secretion/phage lysis holin